MCQLWTNWLISSPTTSEPSPSRLGIGLLSEIGFFKLTEIKAAFTEAWYTQHEPGCMCRVWTDYLISSATTSEPSFSRLGIGLPSEADQEEEEEKEEEEEEEEEEEGEYEGEEEGANAE
nr:unnamed protein product [Spirometra erinaceieuropaei]